MRMRLGQRAECIDGCAGTAVGFAVSESMASVLSIAVEPPQRPGGARLVPVRLVQSADRNTIRLGIELTEYYLLERFRFIRFLHDDPPPSGGERLPAADDVPSRRLATFASRAPEGQVLVSRETPVLAGRRAVGSFAGADTDALGLTRRLRVLALDPRGEVTVAIAATDGVDDDGIRLRLSPREFAKLPAAGAERRRRAA